MDELVWPWTSGFKNGMKNSRSQWLQVVLGSDRFCSYFQAFRSHLRMGYTSNFNWFNGWRAPWTVWNQWPFPFFYPRKSAAGMVRELFQESFNWFGVFVGGNSSIVAESCKYILYVFSHGNQAPSKCSRPKFSFCWSRELGFPILPRGKPAFWLAQNSLQICVSWCKAIVSYIYIYTTWRTEGRNWFWWGWVLATLGIGIHEVILEVMVSFFNHVHFYLGKIPTFWLTCFKRVAEPTT